MTRQRRLEAVDKLMSVLTLVVAAVFGVQALGLDVNSGAAGGVGGRWQAAGQGVSEGQAAGQAAGQAGQQQHM